MSFMVTMYDSGTWSLMHHGNTTSRWGKITEYTSNGKVFIKEYIIE